MKNQSSKTQDIERHVGQRIRERRIMLGLTQQQLADLIGVTYQHVWMAPALQGKTSELDVGRLRSCVRPR